MTESVQEPRVQAKVCPKCGAAAERLYRTPRGLRCAECVRKMDSSGLGFQ